MPVSLSVHVVFGCYCIFLATQRAAEQDSPWCLAGARSACSHLRAQQSRVALSLSVRLSVPGFMQYCLLRVSFSESLKPDLLTCFLSCILAPTYQRVGNYSVFFTSKQLPMEKCLVIGFEESYFINWSMFKFAFTVALVKVKSNLANALVQDFCWLNINRIWPLELLAERLFSCCFNFIGLIWMTYLYLRRLQDKIGLRFIAEMCFSRPLKDSQDL